MEEKLYSRNDMVKAGCNDCKGCSDCCQGMGESVLLDPYDIRQFEVHLSCTFSDLLREKVRLHVEDGLILPHLNMEETSERCGFLSEAGRCTVHDFRPGLCRLFPLGRSYEGNNLRYFILDGACPAPERTKIKVKKWLDVEEIGKYENFLITWHNLRKSLQAEIAKAEQEPEWIKNINLRFLQIFYERLYTAKDFYGQFEERMACFENLREKGDMET